MAGEELLGDLEEAHAVLGLPNIELGLMFKPGGVVAENRSVKVAIYARISQDREGAGVKVDRQVGDCRQYAEQRGWHFDPELVFTDNDVSAYKHRVRKGYRALCQAILAGQADALVVYHADRLHRSNLELEEFIDLIERTNVPVYSVSGGSFDLATSDGRFMARVIGAAARKESDDKARRIRRKQLEKAERGEDHGGGRRPFGYGGAPKLDAHGNPVVRTVRRRDDETGEDHVEVVTVMDRNVVNEAEAELIREAAQRVLEGESTWSILRDWTARGIRAAGGGAWNNRSLSQILTSSRVVGRRSHHGQVATTGEDEAGVPMYQAAEWPAILDPDTWEGVRAMLPTRSEPLGRRPTYLLSGLVLCPCGAKMRSQTVRGRRRYTCVSGPTGGCGKVSRDAGRLERFVATWVILVAERLGKGGKSKRKVNPDVAALEARILRLEEEYNDDKWTRDQFEYHRDRLEAKLAAALATVVEQVVAGGRRRLGAGGWWDDEETTFDQRRALVLDVVKRVTVLPVGRGYRGDCTWGNTEVLWKPKAQAAMDAIERQAAAEAG